jgi:hypothetical protein
MILITLASSHCSTIDLLWADSVALTYAIFVRMRSYPTLRGFNLADVTVGQTETCQAAAGAARITFNNGHDGDVLLRLRKHHEAQRHPRSPAALGDPAWAPGTELRAPQHEGNDRLLRANLLALRGSSAGLKKVVPVGPMAVHSAIAWTSLGPGKMHTTRR